jgi:hypothetical protein
LGDQVKKPLVTFLKIGRNIHKIEILLKYDLMTVAEFIMAQEVEKFKAK